MIAPIKPKAKPRQRRFKKCLQFKITLMDIAPSIWRRIQVPDSCLFWGLHVAITDCMPWLDSHLHDFVIKNPKTGKEEHLGMPDPDDDLLGYEVLPDWEHRLVDYFSKDNPEAIHRYDFGDGWEHRIELEDILPTENGIGYPRCLDGKRACPPDDVGGTGGYERFLEIIGNPKHKEHKEMLEWAKSLTGKMPFDPEEFDPGKVRFDDPDKRWGVAFNAEEITPDMRAHDLF